MSAALGLLASVACATGGPRNLPNTVVKTSAPGEGATIVRDDAAGRRVATFLATATSTDDGQRARSKFVTWCSERQTAFSGSCESRRLDADLALSHPESGIVADHVVVGWACVYETMRPDDVVAVTVVCH